jgi:hypothetical protein
MKKLAKKSQKQVFENYKKHFEKIFFENENFQLSKHLN